MQLLVIHIVQIITLICWLYLLKKVTKYLTVLEDLQREIGQLKYKDELRDRQLENGFMRTMTCLEKINEHEFRLQALENGTN
jgi:hypothetical protein